jgi:hypothetical protein
LHFAFFTLHSEIHMSQRRHPSQQTTNVPVARPGWRRWLLGAAIVMEAAWIAVLAVLANVR